MRYGIVSLAVLALAIPAVAAKDKGIVVPMKSSFGDDVGTVTLMPAKDGKLMVMVSLKNLQDGVHGIHIHESATCEAPDFNSAGAHFDPVSHQHTNVKIEADGTASYKYEVAGLTMGTGQPNDVLAHGVSVVVHKDPDDMKSDPTGNAGARIACGVLPAKGQ
jgi:Cu-Zn family superoxide dismutase